MIGEKNHIVRIVGIEASSFHSFLHQQWRFFLPVDTRCIDHGLEDERLAAQSEGSCSLSGMALHVTPQSFSDCRIGTAW